MSPTRDPKLDLLDIFIGKWINEGITIPVEDETEAKILTSDIYEWLPGKYFVLHTAYGRVGDLDGGGTELIGYNPATKKFFSRLYDSRGNISDAELAFDGMTTCTWKGQTTGCTAVFTENGKVQTAHHVRLDESGQWIPVMEVVLTKVI